MARYRRHPAEVTSDRLGDDVERWHDDTTPELRDAVAKVRAWLQDIADAAQEGGTS